MQWMARTLVLAFLVTGLAGCLGDDDDGSQTPMIEQPAAPAWVDAEQAWLDGEPTANLLKLGHWEATGGEEVDAWEDYLFVDRGPQIEILRTHLGVGDGMAAVTFEEVATFTGAPAPKDVKVSNDGDWLFLGNDEQLSSTGPPLDVAVPVRAGGFYVVDVSDKSAPSLTSYLPVGPLRGPHMLFYHERADGSEYVYGANGDISINSFDPATGTLTEQSRYAPNVITDVNRDIDVIDAYYQLYTHDIFVMEEAEDATANPGATMMYTASWDAGLHIVDVTDPANPTQLGAWNDFPDGHTGNLHTVATDWVGDRRLTAGAIEVGFEIVGSTPYLLGTEKSILYVWDTTDPANIELLGFWENPAALGPGQGGLVMTAITGDELLSTHNIQFEDGRIYMAHYGLGLWVLDALTLDVLAVHDADGMNTWDVMLHDGVIYTSGAAGVQALWYPEDLLGPGGPRGRA